MQARIDTVGGTCANYIRRNLADMQTKIDTAVVKALGEPRGQPARILKQVKGANEDINNHRFRLSTAQYSGRIQSCLYGGIAVLFCTNWVSSMPVSFRVSGGACMSLASTSAPSNLNDRS